ncbi:MAG: hypothetical protein RBT71_01080 [Flavobacteriales bacterium]|jgi:hypothetical protein|nr:hypothetical protein [Flavobacteriales bacterium]
MPPRQTMTTETISLPKQLTDMPAHARAWVYKAPRDLSQAELKLVRDHGHAFTSTWAAHGAPLDACVDVLHARFVVVAVDEDQARASGCSIDKSVGFIKQLEHDLNVMLTDRMIVVYEADGAIASCHLNDLPGLIAQGVVTGETIVFDDLVPTVGELRDRFRAPLRTTWLERYLH